MKTWDDAKEQEPNATTPETPHDHDRDDLFPEDEEMLDFSDATTITMVDEETGEEFEFSIVDDFEFEGEIYCVLVTIDEEEPEAVFARVITMEDGTDGFTTLEEDEFERVTEEYERLCEEDMDDDDHVHDMEDEDDAADHE